MTFSRDELSTLLYGLDSLQKDESNTASPESIDAIRQKLLYPERILETTIYDLNTGRKSDGIDVVIESKGGEGAIQLKAKGYSDCCSEDDCGTPLFIENDNGSLRVSVWSDINQEEATHTIDMSGARNNARDDYENEEDNRPIKEISVQPHSGCISVLSDDASKSIEIIRHALSQHNSIDVDWIDGVKIESNEESEIKPIKNFTDIHLTHGCITVKAKDEKDATDIILGSLNNSNKILASWIEVSEID